MSTQANKGTSSVYLNLAPGTYVALDLASTAKTPPLTVFTVWPSHHPAAMPKAGAAISTREFGFTGATKIYDGQTVRWGNPGFLVHMIQGIKAPNLATAKKIAADLKAGNDNAAQANWPSTCTAGTARSRTASRSSRSSAQKPWILGDSVLHGHPGRPRAHHPRHGKGHPDPQVDPSIRCGGRGDRPLRPPHRVLTPQLGG